MKNLLKTAASGLTIAAVFAGSASACTNGDERR